MRFRGAGLADVPAVVELVESAYRGASSRGGWTTEADLLGGPRTDAVAVSALIDALVLAVDADGAMLGCCQLELRAPASYFGTFAVRPDGQARGTGSALLAEAERRARTAGATTLEMTVLGARLDLIPWYERRGYARTGETRPFPYGDERFGIPRRDDLAFVVLAKEL